MPSSQGDEAPAQPPLGFPSLIKGPMAWSGEIEASFKAQTLELGPADVAEVEQAVKHFLGTYKA
jgi:hypothetical protein